MTPIHHHIPEALLADYARGALDEAFSLVLATHISLCDQCRATLGALEAPGGVLLEEAAAAPVSDAAKAAVLAQLDDALPQQPVYRKDRLYPAPLDEFVNDDNPRWSKMGGGVKQMILTQNASSSARLLYIPAGQAVPDHGHNGMELTLVLQGAFVDETGTYAKGDLEIADSDLEHTPVAAPGAPCICLAATDAALRFNSLIPRLLQPIFRI